MVLGALALLRNSVALIPGHWLLIHHLASIRRQKEHNNDQMDVRLPFNLARQLDDVHQCPFSCES